ncbi:hypothetical protein NAI68_11725, partial [Francisella tularensis subsp. holarctica]|nr:hypothetical protein [Francisella tularensis subsp. holarctica]
QATSDTQSQQQQVESTVVGCKIQPYMQYTNLNQNGYLVEQGVTNAKGYFIEAVAKGGLGDTLTLGSGLRGVSHTLNASVV